MDGSKRWVTLAFTWNGLRALGVPEDALATFPDEFREGMAARASILGDTGTSAPEHWVGGLAGDDLHAIAILFARDDEEHRALHRRTRQTARALRGRAQSVVPRPERHAAVQLRPRPFRVPGPALAAGDEGLRRGTDTRFGRGVGTGRVHPRLPRRRRARGESSAARDPFAQRQLHGLPAAAGARGRVPQLPLGQRRHPRRAGTAGGEVHGPLAQRRTAGVGARRRRPRTRCGPDA